MAKRTRVFARRNRSYAERRYRRGLRSWRRSIRWWLIAPCAALAFVAFGWGISRHHSDALFAGLIAGAASTIAIVFREFAPPYVENWDYGSQGERRTGRVLARIGWDFVEDVETGYGNYDHLAVGPSGVFMLETKNLLGIVEVVDGVPRLRRRHDPDADRALAHIRGRALAASASVSSAIRERTGRRLWVKAIVVFWNDFPQRCVEHDKIAYVHGRELGAYLEALPARFDDAIRAEITGVLDSLKHEAGTTTAT